MTDIPECFICKFFEKTTGNCSINKEIDIVFKGQKACNWYKRKIKQDKTKK